MMKLEDIRCCPACGSLDVEEYLVGYYRCNDKRAPVEPTDLHLAEMYPRDALWYCPDCETHVSEPVSVRAKSWEDLFAKEIERYDEALALMLERYPHVDFGPLEEVNSPAVRLKALWKKGSPV